MSSSTAALRAPSVWKCGFMILALKTALRVWGYSRVIQWIGKRVRATSSSVDAPLAIVRQAEYKVAMAGALYPGRALCLEQSLVLYYLLRRQGVGVEYCHGAIAWPFEAHAWLEYQGEVLNDVAEHTERYARLPRQLP